MGGMSVLMLAMGSVMMVARAGIPSDDDPALAAMATQRAVDRLCRDLSIADAFSEDGGTWTIGMPDLDGDGAREVVEYVWDKDGTLALTRAVNGGPAEVVHSGVRSIQVSSRSSPGGGVTVSVLIVGRDSAGTRAVAEVSMWNTQGY